ncbi:maleylpyruvate isomerase family mycothiol-dependent enzyme [Humibacter soli]
MAATPSKDRIWSAVRAERTALAADLTTLDDAQWAIPSLCGEWTVEDVVAHLTASASVGPVRWMGSVIGARFDFDLHNERRKDDHLGATPAETFERFRRVIDSRTSAPVPPAASLGEIVVHSTDIRRPLGLHHEPPAEVLTTVAAFYARTNAAVPSNKTIRGLHLESTDDQPADGRSTDAPFRYGDGPLVRGSTLALIMTMAGRTAFIDDLEGDGVSVIRDRLEGSAPAS